MRLLNCSARLKNTELIAMAEAVFDTHELERWNKELVKFASKQLPKETRNFIQREGNKQAKYVRSEIKSKTGRKTGNLRKSVRRGKAHKYQGRDWQVRVYSKAPHAHLVEYGHKKVLWGNRTDERVEGKFLFSTAQRQMREEFPKDTDAWLDDLINRGFL